VRYVLLLAGKQPLSGDDSAVFEVVRH